ncbi:MAG: His/Gly/Thr/Pro-type tRNA ligase C-terminal domain-containing protein [Patescibacteria group bacterium]|nr:His/Gly/Thr/Pro-type tRNA ligase C-terminal domain-containing protein [Patescibacteria group bacterium]
MLYSRLFGRPKKEAKKFESISHQLLTQGGFIDQVSSGIFNYLPLGKIVLTKIENIIREEMNNIGAQEVLMPALHPSSLWEKTDRWTSVDVLFKVKSQWGGEYALAPTHEETITPLAKKFIKSYRDLPLALYQITLKYRDEKRPKSGILRGREFGMKDLYSFHHDKKDLENFYQKVIQAYLKIFRRCGLTSVKITEASGGSFTKKFSHEFNVITPSGEVDLIYCDKESCSFAQNEEISQSKTICPRCQNPLKKEKAIEIGNIFDLGTRFSEAFDLKFVDQDGKEKFPIMGCYGIGTTRLMGAIVEVHHDDKGIIWPETVSPYRAIIVGLDLKEKPVRDRVFLVYEKLQNLGVEALLDDREEISPGEKFYDADLIGVPVRMVISQKTKDKIEIKGRTEEKVKLVSLDQLVNHFSFIK